ncbi:ORF4 [Ictalurid herpesvirus 1]|uniref:Uncharacterized protein ORF4 n=1 Tax=Ictalurid herpesvirus 1 (strain Auburn) TaxID=766178 RepID=VG04_ICHVA|nr:ORF4 [Ictalurid herpesvirus 1]NP_041173.1 ORF4 [Ictalurid herpesvirus 1]Q00108.1 RecName: Full=Uncharacterized protein ORF4 [Ictalurid herpesvirus 1 (strain Auburn)]AAA88107.1 ORF4 [Ictalurid herpesvirus 1]AAA88185.1 ORF4 [Ictalurid herpesvirus 1]
MASIDVGETIGIEQVEPVKFRFVCHCGFCPPSFVTARGAGSVSLRVVVHYVPSPEREDPESPTRGVDEVDGACSEPPTPRPEPRFRAIEEMGKIVVLVSVCPLRPALQHRWVGAPARRHRSDSVARRARFEPWRGRASRPTVLTPASGDSDDVDTRTFGCGCGPGHPPVDCMCDRQDWL